MPRIIAVYPGSFDPVHYGHVDIIDRCRPLFDEVIVAILHNTEKRPLFSIEDRVEMMRDVLAAYPICRVASFTGLLVDFIKEVGGQCIVRGLRAVSDFEAEFQMALMNRRLSPGTETVYLTPKEEYSYLSSRLIKDVYLLGGDLTGLVPPPALERIRRQVARPATG